MTDIIQNSLNSCALIIRKYNLGSQEFFNERFQGVDEIQLLKAWEFAQKEIQNVEIIKDSTVRFTKDELLEIESKISRIGGWSLLIYLYLNQEFNPKTLKLSDENIERRIRHILAETYIDKVELEVREKLFKQYRIRLLFRYIFYRLKTIAAFVQRNIFLIAIIGISIYYLAPIVLDGFTKEQKLLQRYLRQEYPLINSSNINEVILEDYLYNHSKYEFNGAICNDGWVSHSQGRGTCSHHGGVSYYFYKGDNSMTREECKFEAKRILNSYKQKALKRSWRN